MASDNLQRPKGFYKRGNVWWFGRTEKGALLRLSTGHEALEDAISWVNSRPEISILAKHRPASPLNPYHNKPFEFTDEWVRDASRNTKYRQRNGLANGLTEIQVRQLIARSNGKCEVTGLPFADGMPSHAKRRPFAPSIDRINSTLPYSIDNCRLVCFSVNVALNQWGDGIFDLICLARCTSKLAAL